MEKELIMQNELLAVQPKSAITVISKSRIVNIAFDRITHVSKYGYESVIYTGDEQYQTRLSLQEIMNELPVNNFFRIHKSYIISLRHIIGVSKKRIIVGEYSLPASGYYKLQVIKRLQNLLDKEYEFHGPG